MNAARTAQEACAREIDSMARGHVAHEHVVLARLATCIRNLPASESAAAAILDAAFLAHVIKQQVPGDERRLMVEAMNRLIMVSNKDPMEPYSDRDLWWPRARLAA